MSPFSMRLAAVVVIALAGSAHAAPWTEWVGDYKGALTWRGCTAPGARTATVGLDAVDGALAIDLAAAKGGLRGLSLVEDERGTLSAQDGDIALSVAHRPDGVDLSIDLESGCSVRGHLVRAREKVAACDRLVTVTRIAERCTKVQLPPSAPLATKWKASDASSCRARTEPLELALGDAGCMPVETPRLLGMQCRQVADDAAKLMRCPSLPPEVHALTTQLRSSVVAVSDPAQRELAEQACRRAHEALAEVAVQARCPL